jgi:hypothetical protein
MCGVLERIEAGHVMVRRRNVLADDCRVGKIQTATSFSASMELGPALPMQLS